MILLMYILFIENESKPGEYEKRCNFLSKKLESNIKNSEIFNTLTGVSKLSRVSIDRARHFLVTGAFSSDLFGCGHFCNG